MRGPVSVNMVNSQLFHAPCECCGKGDYRDRTDEEAGGWEVTPPNTSALTPPPPAYHSGPGGREGRGCVPCCPTCGRRSRCFRPDGMNRQTERTQAACRPANKGTATGNRRKRDAGSRENFGRYNRIEQRKRGGTCDGSPGAWAALSSERHGRFAGGLSRPVQCGRDVELRVAHVADPYGRRADPVRPCVRGPVALCRGLPGGGAHRGPCADEGRHDRFELDPGAVVDAPRRGAGRHHLDGNGVRVRTAPDDLA
jgi:hypothetical protein